MRELPQKLVISPQTLYTRTYVCAHVTLGDESLSLTFA